MSWKSCIASPFRFTAARRHHSTQLSATTTRTRVEDLTGIRSLPAVYRVHTNIRSEEEPEMATTTKMPAATNSSPGVKTQATHQRGIPAAGLLGIPAVRLGTVVERTTELSDEVLGRSRRVSGPRSTRRGGSWSPSRRRCHKRSRARPRWRRRSPSRAWRRPTGWSTRCTTSSARSSAALPSR